MDRSTVRTGVVGSRIARTSRVLAVAVSLAMTTIAVEIVPAAKPAQAVEAPVALGAAATFAVLSGASVDNTVTGPVTVLHGDLGVSALTGAIAGFPPGTATGTTYVYPSNAWAVTAHGDLVAAYADAAARSSSFVLAGDLIGQTLLPGVHRSVGAVANTGLLTLDGQGAADSVFIFQIGGAFNLAAGARVLLTGGAQASNVFWQVNGAGTLGANSEFVGTLLALDAIGVGAGSIVNGRVLALNGAISLNSNVIYSNPPVVTIDGGTALVSSVDAPTISGTTDVGVGRTVIVHVGTESLTSLVLADGSWTVVSALLANGTYTIEASVTDPVGNIGLATQALTIDTVLPVVTITGGATALTNDATPTLRGTSDESAGAIVSVSIDGTLLRTLVQVDGSWNATPAWLVDGVHAVVVSVMDRAGNSGVAVQALTVASLLTPAPSLPTREFTAVGPKRLFDTRPGQSTDALVWVPKAKVGGEYVLRVLVANLDGYVPAAGVGAVALTVTVTEPVAAGFITVYACGARELVSSLNFVQGQTVANTVIAPLSANGSVCVFSSAPTDVLADISGWFASGRGFTPIGPVRAFDTRPGESPQALVSVPKSMVGSGNVIAVRLVDLAGHVPVGGVGAVSMNVTVSNPTEAGFITVDSCGVREFVSNLNFVLGETVATAVVSAVSSGGTMCFYSSVPTHLIVDLNGWFSDQPGYTSVSPKRLLDTRFGQSPNALRVVSKQKVGGTNELRVQVTDLAGVVPLGGVGAVVLSLVATNGEGSGFVTVYPCGGRGQVSNLNFTEAETVSNLVISPVSSDGSICLFSPVPVDLVVDVSGWFADS